MALFGHRGCMYATAPLFALLRDDCMRSWLQAACLARASLLQPG